MDGNKHQTAYYIFANEHDYDHTYKNKNKPKNQVVSKKNNEGAE